MKSNQALRQLLQDTLWKKWVLITYASRAYMHIGSNKKILLQEGTSINILEVFGELQMKGAINCQNIHILVYSLRQFGPK